MFISNSRQLIDARTPDILVEDHSLISREAEDATEAAHQLLEPPQVLLAGAACSPGAALAAAQSLVSVWADQSSVTWGERKYFKT